MPEAEIKDIPEKFKKKNLAKELLDVIPIELIREFKAFVFDKENGTIHIGAVDHELEALQQYLKNTFSGKVIWYKVKEEDVNFILDNYARDFKEEILSLLKTDIKKKGLISDVIDLTISYALVQKVSDVHIEPTAEEIQVRFRIDGMLYKMFSIPLSLQSELITRFKVLANLKIDESRRPQEGRIERKLFAGILLRVSIVPTLFGEKVVMRVMDDSNKNLELADLGFSEQHREIILKNIDKPYGMILVSGPTGSGKTTTLYSLLQLLKKDGINISTLEDPIEYALKGVNQIQINKRVALDFSTGLRALLRQDPDVIMVGEVRDSETAIMASDAAMTGHLVFSTVHTNNAPSVFVRLMEMGVEDFVIASTINFIIAQRLVRRVCPDCAEKRPLDEAIVKKVLNHRGILSVLEQKYHMNEDALRGATFSTGVGCDTCIQSGYSGRIGIYELLDVNKKIHDMILAKKPAADIKEALKESGYVDMVEDGVSKVMEGVTTFTEVIRTTKDT